MIQDEETAASSWLKETQKGYIRLAILILLSKKPHHGYELMKEIRVRTKGFWRPTAGGMYPILKDLQESRYIRGEWDAKSRRRKRVYKITKAGSAVLKRALEKENQLAVNMRSLFEEYLKSVLEVKSPPDQPFRIPHPFADLLKETGEGEEEEIKRLEEQRGQIEGISKQLKKNLGIVKKRLKLLKQQQLAP